MPKTRHRLRTALYHRVSTREQNPRLARSELRAAAAAQRGALDVVLVQRLDRSRRSTLDLLANLRRLRSAGVGFVTTAQGLAVRPQHDAVLDLTFPVLAAVAEQFAGWRNASAQPRIISASRLGRCVEIYQRLRWRSVV